MEFAFPILSTAAEIYNRFYMDVGKMLAAMEIMRRFAMMPGADYHCFNLFFYKEKNENYPVNLDSLEKELPHIVTKIMNGRACDIEIAEVDKML